jgi:putative DNA primase/helicase
MAVARKPGLQPFDDLAAARATRCTDTANAGRFAEANGPYVRWTPEMGWLVWDGYRWQKDALRTVSKIGCDVAEQVRAEAAAEQDSDIADALWKHAKYTASERGITAFLNLAKPLVSCHSDEFDNSPWLLNCTNTTLNFENLNGSSIPVTQPHSTADMLTHLVPRDWNFGAGAPTWERFLERIMPNKDMRDFLQRAVGYSVLGTTRETVFFVLYGTGANGKSTFLNTILNVLGSDLAHQADPASFMAQRYDGPRPDLADLHGKRFAAAIETSDSRHLDEALVKSATGGEKLRARHLYCEAFEFQPQFTLWLATNHKPRIMGTDFAIWRRVKLIPFTQRIEPAEQDKDLPSKLLREAEGILNWVVEGAAKYVNQGLAAPSEVEAATSEYRSAEDVLGRFLDECAVRVDTAQVSRPEIYSRYREWAAREGEKILSARRFNAYLEEQGVEIYRTPHGRFWIGLGLLANPGNEAE